MESDQHTINSTNNNLTIRDSQIEEDYDDYQNFDISKNNLPRFSKIIALYDGKKGSNNVLNHAISISQLSGAEITIVRILENIDSMENITVESIERDDTGPIDNKDLKRKVEGDILDDMEQKIKECKQAGCENPISYKFRTGNAVHEIVNEIKDGNYNLVILKSRHIDSWMKSLFSDARKIIGNINIPVMIVD
ncbi:MAG: universal stress protein [Nitrososphaeraceae archaeon]|nr:universal stress protein [Nitrososphaeraceae archaeon]